MQVDPENTVKALLTAIIAAVSMRFGTIGELLLLFISAVTLDYITGISAAVYNKELSSGQGFRGVLKKVGQFCVIVVALICDEAATLAASRIGFTISTGGAITAVVIIWLILNELISILENIARLNVALPPFLISAIKSLKQRTETGIEQKGNEPESPQKPV